MSINTSIVNGISFPPFIDQAKYDALVDFPLRSDDVFLTTHAKAGTTWLQQIAKLIKLNGEKNGSDYEGKHIYETCPWFEMMGREAAMAVPSPRTFKSHLHYHMMPGGDPANSVAKFIYVVRNPKDAIVSQYYHTRLIKPLGFDGDWDCFFELLMQGKAEMGLWFDHVIDWWKHRDADNILFLRYEDMKKDLPGAVRAISQFMGYDLDQSQIESIADQSSFEKMKADPLANPQHFGPLKDLFRDEGEFIRKGAVGDWRNHFSEEQLARFNAEYAKRMAGVDLKYNN